jgi:hypothetical protein
LPNAEFVDLERKDTLEMLSAEPELFLREASLPFNSYEEFYRRT